MGYMQGSQTRSKYKSTDSAQNHVDRVRVPDSNCQFGGPGRGSGWRHRSLSNIDLTSQSKHSFTKQTKGYTSSLYDLYSRLENRKDQNDLENLYGNTNVNSAEKVESIYDRIEQTLDTINKSESCSLRRTRSLAVIREETFNDLQIGGGIRSRRSQLIPRAKLLNRSFFQNRSNSSTNNKNSKIHRKKYRGEDDSGSGVDTQTSETRESDDYCGNLKKVQGAQIIQKTDQKLLPALWVNDKSDLDSLDSDYFKNSLHQLDGSGIYSTYEGKGSYTGRIIGTPDISLQNGYIDDNLSLRSDEQEQSPLPDYCTIKTDEIYSNNKFVSAEDVSVIHVNGGGGGGGNSTVDTNTFKANRSNGQLIICENKQTENRRESDIVGIDESETDRRPKFREDHKSVISYDSIYLSSEGSNEAATIIEEEEEKINEYLSDNNYSTLSEYMNTKKDIKASTTTTTISTTETNKIASKSNIESIVNEDGENLYSQINKIPQARNGTNSCETKTKLTTFSDISNRGTLERLTFITSGSGIQNSENNKKIEKPLQQTSSISRDSVTIENQYCSLPLANINRSLQASERIDAKLRLSCYPLEEQTKIYDSITNFGRAHKKLRQRESYEPSPPIPIPIQKETKSKEPILIAFSKSVPEQAVTIEPAIINTTPIITDDLDDSILNAVTENISNVQQNTIDETNQLVKTDEDIISLFSADLNEVENLSTKNCEIEEIREKPKNISLRTKQKPIEYSSSPDIQISRDNIIEETVDVPVVKLNRNGGHKSYQKSHYSKRQHHHYGKSGDRFADSRENRIHSNLKVNLSNTLKRRLENKTKHNLNEKLTRNIDKSRHYKHHHRVQQAIIENIKTHIVQPNFNMSRPQIMHVIDSKRNLPKSSLKNSKENKENEMINVNTTVTGQAKHEMLRKVDSVRSYWSKLIDTVDGDEDDMTENLKENPNLNASIACIAPAMSADSTLNRILNTNKLKKSNQEEMVLKPPTISVSNNTLRRAASTASGLHSLFYSERDELNSYTPSVEIVELDDQKQAAIVKVQGVDAEDFDHVRYKVMKTDTFQKNLLNHTRKEPPLDGLLQYLNDYRFQELLTQNNVVIIEPVRTKVEPISNKSHDSSLLTCKITAGAGKADGSKSGLRKHFFYHPIRVNKELIDEELPTPDTVRNAKKLFEETLLLCPMKAQKSRSMIGLNENCKNIDRKYLTLETFNNGQMKTNSKHSLNPSGIIYNGNGNVCNRIKKWDSSSLSSGISSGDLSSPCDCNDNDDTKIMPNENANELCESYYVSQDILEKIRECGSSVTYYGGRVLDNQSPEVSPMTKAIMREIHHSDTNICEVCHPHNVSHANRLYTSFCDANKNHLGMKLRLIKSNSCNSRLELAGTRFNDGPLQKFCSRNRSISNTEDTVRNIIQRIETNAIQEKRVPRIIESKCIEKAATDASKVKSTNSFRAQEFSGLSKSMDRLGPIEILSQVSVKNHINAIGMKANSSSCIVGNNNNIDTKVSKEILMPRNKDVDLALQMNIKSYKENDKIKTATRKEVLNGNKEKNNTDEIRSSIRKTGPITATVRPTSLLTKAELDERQQIKETHKAILEDLCKVVAKSEEEKSKKNNLVKWDSLEKNYFANDMVLRRKPKYDDIEFEEFEVIEPKK